MSNENGSLQPTRQPLRSWVGADHLAEMDATLIVDMADAYVSLLRLLSDDEFSDLDQIAFGRLNAFCVAYGYEPIVDLISKRPTVEPAIRGLAERAALKVRRSRSSPQP